LKGKGIDLFEIEGTPAEKARGGTAPNIFVGISGEVPESTKMEFWRRSYSPLKTRGEGNATIQEET